jgi:hypothetical protein
MAELIEIITTLITVLADTPEIGMEVGASANDCDSHSVPDAGRSRVGLQFDSWFVFRRRDAFTGATIYINRGPHT